MSGIADDRDRSLFVCDGDTPGRVLVTCYANCDRQDIIEELKRQGLWPSTEHHINHNAHRQRPPQVVVNNSGNVEFALKIWRNSVPADGTLVETYLRSRAITLSPLPLTLRCHMALRHAPSNGRWPARLQPLVFSGLPGQSGRFTTIGIEVLLTTTHSKGSVSDGLISMCVRKAGT